MASPAPSSVVPTSLSGRPQNDDFWSTKIHLIDHCAMCLARISGARRDGVLKMEHIWSYLRENWEDFPITEYSFIVGRKEDANGSIYLESKVPSMCALCKDSVRTLDKLHQELIEIQKRIETQVSGIQKLMKAMDFEEECTRLAEAMNVARLPLSCVENSIKFLGLLHGRQSEALANFLQQKMNEPAFVDISTIAVSHFFQKEATQISDLLLDDDINQDDFNDFLEVKPDVPSSTQDVMDEDLNGPPSNTPVIKTEPYSDYDEGHRSTPPPRSLDLDKLMRTETQNSGGANKELETKDTLRKSDGDSSSSRRRSSRRGTASRKRYFYKSDDDTDTDSEIFVPDNEDAVSSESDCESSNSLHTKSKPFKSKNSISSSKQSQGQEVSCAKSPKSKKAKRVTRSSSRRSKTKPKSDADVSFSDEDSNLDLNRLHPEDESLSDCAKDPLCPPLKKTVRKSCTRLKSESTNLQKKIGRPRIHPAKEGKAQTRNTLCEICCIKLPEKSLLFEHLKIHVKDFACRCETCGNAYYSKKRMEAKHYKKAVRCRTAAGYPLRPKATPKKCETCDFQTDSFLTLKAHLQEHEVVTEQNFTCPLPDCTDSFTTRQMTEYHIDKHLFQGTSSAASQKCPVCSEGIEYAKMDMKTHLQTAHNIVDIIPCNYCKHVFHTNESLIEHYSLHMKGNVAIGVCCHLCDLKIRYYKLDHLREHYYTAHQIGNQFSCDKCDYKTFSIHNLKGHQATKHEGKYRKTFTCQICTNPPVFCRSKDNLVTHNIKVHGAKPYVCKVCNETFDTKLLWSRHEKSHFGIAPVRRQQCPHCNKTFNILSRLQYHIERVHAEKPMERTFKCNHCDKSYFDSHGLKRHVQAIHLGIKYICEECGIQFSEKGPLKNHMRRHSGARPFSCCFCTNTFRYKDAHRRHEESHMKLGDKFQPGRTFDRKRKPL